MGMRPALVRFLIIIALAGAPGCAHYVVNEKLEKPEPARGYRFENLRAGGDNTDSLLVCLTFSGGGTRAAALATGVLEELRDAQVVWKGKKKRLLDEVDVISSVSGGSFTAAYYALFRDRVFQDFRERFLDRDLEAELEWKTVLSFWWLPFSRDFSRGDLAAEVYDESIFDGKTFKDLIVRGERPFVVINATDLATAQAFAFTQAQFDLLGSDLAAYPVSCAVAASSAVPVVIAPLTIWNYGMPQGTAVPRGIADALARGREDPRLERWARGLARYYEKKERPSWHHLADGGVADNSGARAIWAELRRTDGFLRKLIESGRVERLVVVSVNAEAELDMGFAEREHHPALLRVARAAPPIVVNEHGWEMIRLLHDDPEIRRLLERSRVAATFAEVDLPSVADAAKRERLVRLPTSFYLEPDAVSGLIEAGRTVLRRTPAWQKLLQEIGK